MTFHTSQIYSVHSNEIDSCLLTWTRGYVPHSETIHTRIRSWFPAENSLSLWRATDSFICRTCYIHTICYQNTYPPLHGANTASPARSRHFLANPSIARPSFVFPPVSFSDKEEIPSTIYLWWCHRFLLKLLIHTRSNLSRDQNSGPFPYRSHHR